MGVRVPPSGQVCTCRQMGKVTSLSSWMFAGSSRVACPSTQYYELFILINRETRMQFLALDCAGNPSAWLDHETAIHLIAGGRILAPMGERTRVFRGGINARTGLRSCIEVSTILLAKAKVQPHLRTKVYEPPLTNRALFSRDGHLCLYFGDSFTSRNLTRDQVIP